MHEAGLITEVLRESERAARAEGCDVIRRIVLRVGVLSSAVPEALAFAFEAMKAGTCAATAVLLIEREPAVARCDDCQREFVVEELDWTCPGCGEPASRLVRGMELELARVEAEGARACPPPGC